MICKKFKPRHLTDWKKISEQYLRILKELKEFVESLMLANLLFSTGTDRKHVIAKRKQSHIKCLIYETFYAFKEIES